MNSLWRFLRDKRNQQVLGWFGGGLVVAVTGLWVAFVYFFPPVESPDDESCHSPGKLWCRRDRRQRDRCDHRDGHHDQFGLRVKTEIRCRP